MDCDCRACSSSSVILCGDGTCLPRERVCDGRSDCSNSMDEQNCPGSCVDIKETEMVRCSDSRFYPLTEACRGELSQCASSCPDCHPTAAFACRKEHKCIQQSMVCNGIPDCVGGEDERDCDRVCDLENSFKCARSNKNKCIPAEQRCDGIWHCEDKSDEMNCRECPLKNTFMCDGNCHPDWMRCDGFAHCADGSDELSCTCQDCLGSHSNTYMCQMTERCMRRDEACLPYSTCPNATAVDKAYCARLALPSYFFS
ncbi:hypothetical protein WR25_23259 [Diploscapter pachys]|uniref:Uncharacterized protein n=1 Tax=Diploscapter pachys TaxID=2018661 RepID=A0A2A2KD24_9BILA|nr:hypothetical protein WR25_23259 [Diploscapter pachys]